MWSLMAFTFDGCMCVSCRSFPRIIFKKIPTLMQYTFPLVFSGASFNFRSFFPENGGPSQMWFFSIIFSCAPHFWSANRQKESRKAIRRASIKKRKEGFMLIALYSWNFGEKKMCLTSSNFSEKAAKKSARTINTNTKLVLMQVNLDKK